MRLCTYVLVYGRDMYRLCGMGCISIKFKNNFSLVLLPQIILTWRRNKQKKPAWSSRLRADTKTTNFTNDRRKQRSMQINYTDCEAEQSTEFMVASLKNLHGIPRNEQFWVWAHLMSPPNHLNKIKPGNEIAVRKFWSVLTCIRFGCTGRFSCTNRLGRRKRSA